MNLNSKQLYHRMVELFISSSSTVSTVESSSSFNGFPFAVVSPSIGRCVPSLSLAVVCIPFINGVTCNGQNILPYLFIGLVDLSLVSTFVHLIRFDFLSCLCSQIFLNRYYRCGLPR